MKLFYFSLLIGLLGLNFFLIRKLVHYSKGFERIESVMFDSQQRLQVSEDINRDLIKAISRAQRLEGSSIVFSDSLKRDLFKNVCYPKLVFQFDYESNCLECIDDMLLRLKKISEKIGDDKVLLIASFKNDRSLMIFRKKKDISFTLIKSEAVIGESTRSGIPLLYVLSSDWYVDNIFFPNLSLPTLTNDYLELIAHKYY